VCAAEPSLVARIAANANQISRPESKDMYPRAGPRNVRSVRMMRLASLVSLAIFLGGSTVPAASEGAQSPPSVPTYTEDGKLVLPANYREWIYLTSGLDMSYSPSGVAGQSMFDNVFVNPEAYRAFTQTGTWPDKTILVLETRVAATNASINKSGHFQTGELMGREVHVKDEARFPGNWAFFAFDDKDTAKMVPHEAACYSCHEKHAAVDTTFVQFYPTLIEIAKGKATLSPGYLTDEKALSSQKTSKPSSNR
jgi:Cytochrome P460